MTSEDVFRFVLANYATKPDFPWASEAHKDAAVLRHKNSRKWYGLIMRVDGKYLDEKVGERYEVMNVKVEPGMALSLCGQRGVVPAYHMDKNHWVSIVLKEIDKNLCLALIDKSFELTRGKEDESPA